MKSDIRERTQAEIPRSIAMAHVIKFPIGRKRFSGANLLIEGLLAIFLKKKL